MHVITRKRLNEFAERHPETQSPLARWYAIMRKSRFPNLAQLRETFPHADQVGKFTVFNIGGNKVRLIAAVHYNRNKIYIRHHVLTHQEYDAGKWKK
jgi:mRNA interferase HigB